MRTRLDLNRRQFLKRAALAASALPLAAPRAQPAAASGGKIRVGCVSWCFHDFSPGADPELAIERIGAMGFDGIELIVNARDDFRTFWTDARVDRLKRKLDQRQLRVSQFVMFQPVVEGLSSLDRATRERNLDYFEKGCRVGRKFEARLVNIVAPWAAELKGPSYYLPRYYEVSGAKPGQKFHIDIAPGFDWDEVWNTYVRTTHDCLARAKSYGLKFSIENHTHTLLPLSDAFRRLWDRVRDRDLGCNLDVGWTLLQREYPPLAVYKLKPHLFNLHIRDIDGRMRRFPPIGEGVMDLPAIVAALKATGFDGFASLEQDKNPGDRDMGETCRIYLRQMRELLS